MPRIFFPCVTKGADSIQTAIRKFTSFPHFDQRASRDNHVVYNEYNSVAGRGENVQYMGAHRSKHEVHKPYKTSTKMQHQSQQHLSLFAYAGLQGSVYSLLPSTCRSSRAYFHEAIRQVEYPTSRSSCFFLNRRWAGVSMSSTSSPASSFPSPAPSFFPPSSDPDPPASAPSAADPELRSSSIAASCARAAASASSRLRFPFFL